jgi:type II secretory pathway component GspD/PulD (secretin)
MSKLPILASWAILSAAVLPLPKSQAASAEADSAPVVAIAGSDTPAASLDEAAERARLEALPASHIPLKGATLAGAIRLLAESAHMPYLAPPDADFTERVTSDVMMNPFELLQVLAENYNFEIEFHHGIWRFYRINLNELVSKSYTLRFNNLQHVTITSSSINGQLASAGGGMGGMGGTGGMGGGLPSAGGASASGGQGTFSVKPDKIIEDIKKILVVPTVGLATPSLDGSTVVDLGVGQKPQDAPKVEPIWNPDTSQLFVVATRQQHSLIDAYLKTIDRPQKLVRIAVKFVETSRNPQQALGVDWSQTFLGSGGPITLSGASLTTTATATSNAGSATITTSNTSGSSTSTGSSTTGNGSSTTSTGTLNPLSSAINLNHIGNVPLPTTLLSAPAFQWTVQAIASDQRSSVVENPVIYTSNNREVSFKSTTQQPVQQGTTTIGSATAATTSTIAYIDVGTELNILPSILPGAGPSKELIQLNLSINVSSIIGTQIINGNSYPITNSKTYSYSVSVPNGDTLAIAGLEERSRQTNDSKIPILGDIPIIGYAFKNNNDSVLHTTLLAFITPELIRTEGEDDVAEAAPLPALRHRPFQGSAAETKAQIDQSLDGLASDIKLLQACVTRANKEAVINRLDQIGVELALMDVRLGELKLTGDKVTARESALVDKDREQLADARNQVGRQFTVQVN